MLNFLIEKTEKNSFVSILSLIGPFLNHIEESAV